MKTIKILLPFCFLFLSSITNKNSDIERVQIEIYNYTSQINNLLSKNIELIQVGASYFSGFSDDLIGSVEHSNDLLSFNLATELDPEISLTTYSSNLGDEYSSFLLGEFLEDSIQIDECPVNMKGKDVYLVNIIKMVSYQKQTKNFNFLIGVNLESQYKIAFVYFNEVARSEKNIPVNASCISDEKEQEIINIQKKQFTLFKEKGNALYVSGENYFEARQYYEKAYNINNQNQDVIDGIANCNFWILENQKEVIENLISQQKFSAALRELSNIEDQDIINDTWYNTKKEICKVSLEKKAEVNELNRADILFKNNQIKKALTIYQTLQNTKYLDANYISNQIKVCKESDPFFIKKALKSAYDKAVKSKKNYFETFRTYTKYESSGQLIAEQYYFMCLMMLNKHSVVAKPMGYTKNQAKLLSRVYFYKCKDMGFDVSYLETQIFTKNIEKRKN